MAEDKGEVFISYSWDSPEHREYIFDFANRLRRDGIDANIDRFCKIDAYTGAPKSGWPLWMHNGIKDAKNVLMVCTKVYYRRAMSPKEEPPGVGRGVMWEAEIIRSLAQFREETAAIGQAVYKG